MPQELGSCRVAADRVHLPPMAARATFYWDGRGAGSQPAGRERSSDSDPIADEMDLRPSSSCDAIDWQREARSLTCYLDSLLLVPTTDDTLPGAAGDLVWARRGGHVGSIVLYAHPVLLLHGVTKSRQVDPVEIVPQFRPSDPLLHHIRLVLKAEIDAEDVAGRLYAESLTNALAVHFLKRYTACLQPLSAYPRGLAPYKLRRTTTYIQQHLEHDLYLIELAAVAQTSPAHFARLFKQATGQPPHQYVLSCRVERAKTLLTDTVLSLSDISHQVGCTDQSHFTALFRKHAGMTPKVYRDATQRD